MMWRRRPISIAVCLLAMIAIAGCDDPSASQSHAVRPREATSASASQPTVDDDAQNPSTTDPEEVASEEVATKDEPAGNVATEDPAPKDAESESEPATSRPARRPLRRPPPPGETPPPPQPRVVRRTRTAASGGITEITFDTIKFDIEPGDPFQRDMLTKDIEALFGKKVRIRGYIYPPFQQSGIKQFVLVRDNMECCFGPGAALYDCVAVDMVDDKTIDYTVRPVAVEGTLILDEVLGLGGEHLSIFHLDGVKVQ